MEHIENDFINQEASPALSIRSAIVNEAHSFMVLAMLLSDILGIIVAVAAAAVVRYLLMGPGLVPLSFAWLPAYFLFFVISAAMRGLYPAIGMSAIEQFRNLTVATSVIFLVSIGGTFFFQVGDSISRLLMALSWLFCLVTVPFNRTIMRHFLAMAGLWGEPIAVIGRSAGATRISNYYRRYPKIGLRPEVLVSLPGSFTRLDAASLQKVAQRMQQLKESTSLRTVVVVYDNLEEFIRIREFFRDVFEKVILVSSSETGINLGGVNIRQYGDLLTLEIRHSLLDQSAQAQKRIIDVIVAGLGLLLLSPFLALIALAVALDSQGGVFYRQRRIGRGGQEFGMLKFRTMRQDADAVLRSVLDSDEAAKREWDRYQKLADDPRITRVGRFLRRFSLDELPQLFNVLVGEMSIVGPRPIMLNQLHLYGENYAHYIRVSPGITGLWQISGRNHTSFSQRTDFDSEYINNWNIWADIYILVRTAWVVVRRDGAC